MKVKELIKLLQDDGWFLVRTRGSHRQFHHPTKPGTVTVAGKPSVDVPPGTLNNALKQAGLKDSRLFPMKYTVILEQSNSSFGAYVPDLPGCIAAAETKEEALKLIAEAIEIHLEDLRERGEEIPEPHSFVETVEVAA